MKVEPIPYAKLDDPQSLNLYSYARNQPTVVIDLDGHQCDKCHTSIDSGHSPNPAPKEVTVGGKKFMLDNGVVHAVPGEHYSQQQLNWMGGCPLSTCHNFNGLFAPLRPVYMTNIKSQLPMLLLGVVDGVGAFTPPATARIGATGKLGEEWLARNMGGESQVFFPTSLGDRFIDQLAAGIAYESKVGYTSLTRSTRLQIAKDAELMRTGAVSGVEWHFFRSPITGRSGPTTPLANALGKANIPFVVH